ncbi:hypothetical protein BV22DRAFT_1110019 [Leucogyrophana mollusca]|uniref:Uncharacterized protein n=1 Tax=Leucogyrophana mollusca TaxID=85980 RepID=A0ACB8BVH5_9AGAM|nr:hypothetical protein BV22DRAFT_1110019 [Leucogyrophana mollusca]
MTLTLLASVSLLTLVVTSRPIFPETELPHVSSDLQSAVQAVFQSRTGISGQSVFGSDGLRVGVLSTDEQNHALSQLGASSVKATVSLDSGTDQTDEEKLLSKWLGGLNDLDDGLRDDTAADLVPGEQSVEEASAILPQDETPSSPGDDAVVHVPSPPVLVLALSCIAALLVLGCTALGLCIAKHLRSQVLASRNAWELLPRFEKRSTLSGDAPSPTFGASEKLALVQDSVVEQRSSLLSRTSVVADHVVDGKLPHILLGFGSDAGEEEDPDEKFHDALDLSPLPPVYELPADVTDALEQHADPPLPTISVHPPPSPLPGRLDCSHVEMRDVSSSSVSRPAWSLRAAGSPSLGVVNFDESAEKPSQAIMHPRRRAYRYAVPELDIALAMQLRPGLGIGADPAWMVRFLMAIYGWFAVALTGHR